MTKQNMIARFLRIKPMRFFMIKIKVLSLAVFCAASFSVLHAEDLTTLDGNTFSNISDISKYPKQIFFSCNGVRTNASVTNLPEEFRVKHGIVIKTNAPVVTNKPIQQQLSPIDLFLWNNRESELEKSASENLITNGDFNWGIYKCWTIKVKSGEVSLDVYSDTSFHDDKREDLRTTDLMSFDLDKEPLISRVFDKFLEWEDIATTNHAVNFTKEIERRSPNRAWVIYHNQMFGDAYANEMVIYNFEWNDKHATLNVQQPDPYTGNFNRNDIIHFKSLLKQLPSLKEKLATDIQNKVAQKDLFK